MKRRGTLAWQVVLSDLALILFLTTLAASGSDQGIGTIPLHRVGEVAIYREGAGGLSLAQWLDQQPADPRLQLTVQARYAAADFDRIAQRASRLARQAEANGHRPRLLLEPATHSEIAVSLGYDAVPDQSHSASTRLRPSSLAR